MSLALLQLTVLGSVMPCATPAGDGGTHTEHVQHADAAHGAMEIVAASAPADDIPPAPDCAIRACASSPVLLAMREVPADAVRATAEVVVPAGAEPDTPLQLIEPPPPRA